MSSWPGPAPTGPRPVINNMNTPTTESLTLQEQGQQLSVLGAFANSEQFQMAKQAAEMLASSSMVPTTYQNNPDGSKSIDFFIMTHDDETPFVITCEDCSDLSQIAEVREKAIAIAKELSVGYYMENGDEDMR